MVSRIRTKHVSMSYEEFLQQIDVMIDSASSESRRLFALDTIAQIYDSCKQEIQEEMTLSERELLYTLMVEAKQPNPSPMKEIRQQLQDSMCSDDIRTIEFSPNIIELLIALDAWLDYCTDLNSKHISIIENSIFNCIDWSIDPDINGYHFNNVLVAPEMIAEYARAQRLLTSHLS
jgi:hypothetical protein